MPVSQPTPRRGRAGVALAVVVLALGIPSSPASAGDARARRGPDLSGVTIRVGYGAVRDNSTQDIRDASGAFAGTPYKIDWAPFPTSTQQIEALNAGALDMALEPTAPTVYLAQSGAREAWTRKTAPFRVVAAYVNPPEAGAVIAVKPGSGFRRVSDLRGKKVSYVRGGPSHLYWAIAARDAKLKKGDYQPVELPVAEGRSAFLSGAVDALVGVNRTFLPLVSNGQAEILARSNGAAPEWRLTVVRSSYLDDKRQLAAVKDFLARLARAKRRTVKNADRAAEIYRVSARVDAVDAAAAIKEFPTIPVPLDDALAESLNAQVGIFFAEGVAPTRPDTRVLFDTRFVAPDEPTR